MVYANTKLIFINSQANILSRLGMFSSKSTEILQLQQPAPFYDKLYGTTQPGSKYKHSYEIFLKKRYRFCLKFVKNEKLVQKI